MKGKKMSVRERLELLRTSKEERKIVFKEILAHVRRGRSLSCYGLIDERTIFNYIVKFPDEFIAEELDIALRDAQEGWENIGRRQAEGSCIGNSRSWFYNMAHRYKWSDRVDVTTEHKGEVKVNIVNYGSPSTSNDIIET